MSDDMLPGAIGADVPRASQLEIALARFAELQDAGKAPDREAFFTEYPECADELRECLAQIDLLGGLARVIQAERKQAEPGFMLGDYRLLRQIARGGMGIVYEGVQTSTGCRVAIKMLPALAAIDPRAVQRFRNEVQAATVLEHPNIVDVVEAGNHDGIEYYAMRYIEGRTLAQLLTELRRRSLLPGFRTPINPRELARIGYGTDGIETSAIASHRFHSVNTPVEFDDTQSSVVDELDVCYFQIIAEIAIQTLDGLEYAHQQGVLHRDIKPSNLLLDENGHVWILDFGLARIEQSDTLTQTGDWLGTLRYMSPELLAARHSSVDHRNDIYSLGATIYEALTLVPVVSGSDRADIITKVMRQQPIPPSSHQRRIPRDLETVILKAISREKEDRYNSCAEMADDLRRFLGHQRILARRPGIARQFFRCAQRNPEMTVAGVFSTILVLACGIFSLWWISSVRQQTLIEQSHRLIQEQATRSAEETLRMHREVSRTILAAQALKNADYELVDELLSRPPMVGHEFPLRLQREIVSHRPEIIATSTGSIYSVRVSPDEQLLAMAGQAGVQILHRTNGRVAKTLCDHEGDVNSITWSADGKWLATCGDDGVLNVYSTSDWSRQTFSRVDGAIVMAAFSEATGKIAFCERVLDRDRKTCGKNALYVIERVDGQKIFEDTDFSDRPEALDLSPDGSKVAIVGCDAMLRIYNMETLNKDWTLRLAPAEGKTFQASCVAFANTTPLVVAGCRGEVIRVFNYETGDVVCDLPESLAIEGIAFSPNDRAIVAGSRRGQLMIWESTAAGNWRRTGEFRCSQPIWTCDFATDGSLFVGGNRGYLEKVNVCLMPDRQRIRIPDNAELEETGFQRTVQTGLRLGMKHRAFEYASQWSVPHSGLHTGVARPPATTVTAMLEPRDTDKWVVGLNASQTVGAFTPGTAEVRHLVYLSESGEIEVLDYNADTKQVVAGSGTDVVVFDAESLERRFATSLKDNGRILAVAVSEDSRTIYVAHAGRPEHYVPSPITVLDANTLTRIESPHRRILTYARHHPAYSPGALNYVAGLPDTFCDTEPGKALLNEQVTQVAVSKDRSVLVLAHGRSTLHVYHNEVWQEPLIIHLGTSSLTDLDLSPDGSVIAVSDNERVTLFHAMTGRELYDLRSGLFELHVLRFSRDGSLLLGCGRSLTDRPEVVVWGNPQR